MKIDSHQHFWKYDPRKHGWIDESMAAIRKDFSPSEMAPILQKNGFDGCVAVQVEQSEAETECLLDLADQHSFIKGVVGWVDLAAENVRERLLSYKQNPNFKGIRHTQYDSNGEFLLQPGFQKGMSDLAELGLTFDLLVFDYQLPAALELVRKFPNQAFVLNHLAKPNISAGVSKEWKENIKALGGNPNVTAKLSGLVTQTKNFRWKQADFRPFLEAMLETFGTDRLMFGSDWPVASCAVSFDDTVEIIDAFFSGCSHVEKQAIFGKNASRFYGLEP